jgi:hypothetical protein
MEIIVFPREFVNCGLSFGSTSKNYGDNCISARVCGKKGGDS